MAQQQVPHGYELDYVRLPLRLVVRPKGHDEAAAAAALAEVSAMARPTELRGTRGKLYQVGRDGEGRGGVGPSTGREV